MELDAGPAKREWTSPREWTATISQDTQDVTLDSLASAELDQEAILAEFSRIQRNAVNELMLKQERALRALLQRREIGQPCPPRKEVPINNADKNVELTKSEMSSDGGGGDFVHPLQRASTRSLSRRDSEATTASQKARLTLNRAIDWWKTLEEPPRQDKLAKFVRGSCFESVCLGVIVCNSIFIAVSLNYMAGHIGQEAPLSFKALELFFSIFYLIEICLRLAVHRLYFLVNNDMGWNITDLLLVMLSTWHQVVNLLDEEQLGVSLNFLRSFRIMKLARLLRLVRVIRVFRDLRVMFDAFLNSIFALFWCLVLLGFTIVMFAFVFVQMVTDFLNDTVGAPCVSWRDTGLCVSEELHNNFGSVTRAMLTLYMSTTGGNDWEYYWALLRQTGQLSGTIFVFYTAFYFFGVFNLLTGMFVDKAVKATQPDVDALNLERRAAEKASIKELERIFREADFSHEGTLTREDVRHLVKLEDMKEYLDNLGLFAGDCQVLFEMLMNADGQVPVDLFVRACVRMKGTAASMDLQAIQANLWELQKGQNGLHDRITVEGQQLRFIEHSLEPLSLGNIKMVDLHTVAV